MEEVVSSPLLAPPPRPPELTPDIEKLKAPADVQRNLDRGEARQASLDGVRRLCWEFWRGNQYTFLSTSNYITNLGTLVGSKKPRHRARLTFNLLVDVVAKIVSAATQKVPNYEVNPSKMDPESVGAARLAGKVARYGYDKWGLKRVTEEVITSALVADEGFVWPFFDNTVGPVIGHTEAGKPVGMGEVKLRTLSSSEVFWEPGQSFMESRWHVVKQGRTPDELYNLPDFLGGGLSPDASADVGEQAQLVFVTEYLERPSPRFPRGRWLTLANKRIILPPQEYPCSDPSGETLDEPVLHMLSYIVDPTSERDQGLVRHTLDAQRLHNRSMSKAVEWQDHCLSPQMMVPEGSLVSTVTDQPGLQIKYRPHPLGARPEWRVTPPIPPELFTLSDRAKESINNVAAQNDIPSGVTASAAVQSLLDRDQGRQVAFLANLAEFHSRLMRHCLYLVQKHYTEPRLLRIRGRFGPESVEDFLGAQLLSQVDVTVNPGDLAFRSRSEIKNMVYFYAQQGWISPEVAMASVQGGSAESLLADYELDVAWQNHEIQQMRKLSGTLDPMSAASAFVEAGVPIPRWFDNDSVHMQVLASFMKTSDFANSHPVVQEAMMEHYRAHEQQKQQKDMQKAEAQSMQAEALGAANAAAPQGVKSLPSQPNMGGDGPSDGFRAPGPA